MTDTNHFERIYTADAAPFTAIDVAEPPMTVLVSLRRANHSNFQTTAIPTHADVEVVAHNGGRTSISDLDLKTLGPADLADIVAKMYPQAKSLGVAGPDADVLGPIMVAAITARHLTRNLEGA